MAAEGNNKFMQSYNGNEATRLFAWIDHNITKDVTNINRNSLGTGGSSRLRDISLCKFNEQPRFSVWTFTLGFNFPKQIVCVVSTCGNGVVNAIFRINTFPFSKILLCDCILEEVRQLNKLRLAFAAIR